MLPCLKPSVPPTGTNALSPTSQGRSGDNTPASSVQASPTINLSREYTLALQTNSYREICRTFDQDTTVPLNHHFETSRTGLEVGPHSLDHVLQPSRDHVQEALSQIPLGSLSHLISAYFEQSEQTTHLCLHLYHSVQRTRDAYFPVHDLLEILPFESGSHSYPSLSHSQCKLAYEAFCQFDRVENPFSDHPPDLPNFDSMRSCFSDLTRQLNRRVRKSRLTVNRMRKCTVGSAFCLIAVTVGIAVSAVAIGAHAVVALVAGPLCPAVVLPSTVSKRESVRLAQLDVAAMGAYVLGKDMDTIERLLARLQAAVENDKLLVRMGVERGLDGHSIQEVLKQLGRNRAGLMQQLKDLEEHVFLCFVAIKWARKMLLREICPSQDPA